MVIVKCHHFLTVLLHLTLFYSPRFIYTYYMCKVDIPYRGVQLHVQSPQFRIQ